MDQETLEEIFDYFPRLKERLKQKAGTLSGGEQQMLAVGRALIIKPRLILLDEPTEGLMPLLVQAISQTVKAINAKGNHHPPGGTEPQNPQRGLSPHLYHGKRFRRL